MKPASFPSRGRGWDLPGGGEKPRVAPRGRFLEHRVLAKVCTSRGRRQGWAASVAGRRHPAGQGIELQPWGSAGEKPTLLSRSGRDKKKKKGIRIKGSALLCSAAVCFVLQLCLAPLGPQMLSPEEAGSRACSGDTVWLCVCAERQRKWDRGSCTALPCPARLAGGCWAKSFPSTGPQGQGLRGSLMRCNRKTGSWWRGFVPFSTSHPELDGAGARCITPPQAGT